MHRLLSRRCVRDLDRRAIEEYGIPGVVLMENAGRGVTDQLCAAGVTGRVAICCGKGNNGGDGLVLARHLDLRGYDVEVFCWNPLDAWHGDAATNARIVAASAIPLTCYKPDDSQWPTAFAEALSRCEWGVDALLGTGATGAPRSPGDQVIELLNSVPLRRLAVDLPSGLDCDTGEVHRPTFRADLTVTLAAAKPGLVQPESAEYVGDLHVADIGVPRVLLEAIFREQR
ncbi:MAG: NAD(P)H-hydrate epimerase [Planctomycetales bacterium]|nr:NAD(P)H-hydrate epimerase [Planctomycetales bacterium]